MASAGKKEASPGQSLAATQVNFGEIQQIIDGLVEQIALIDCDGTILAVNESWGRQVERQAHTGLHISRDYVGFLVGLIEDGDQGVVPILRAFQDVSAGQRRTFRCVYHGQGAFAGYDFTVMIMALVVHQMRCILVSVHDVTELVTLKRQKRRIGGQVLRAQEAERRHIARELHDSTSQLLVALQLDLALLSQDAGPEVDAVIAKCSAAVQVVQQEIRTFSFLAHPPSLVANNLASVLHDLVRGFAVRTGVEIDIDVSDCGEVSSSIEAALYRLTQEALTNIHRHSGATQATVRLLGKKSCVHLMIQDNGIGFEALDSQVGPMLGVGVLGMRERVRELGGRLSIHRAIKGTVLTVSFPRQKRMIFAPQIGRLKL